MKGKYDIINSYTYSHSDWEQEAFFSSIELSEIESDICRLQTFSRDEHRNLARKVYSKIRDRISNIHDGKEKNDLQKLAHLIDMKIKFV